MDSAEALAAGKKAAAMAAVNELVKASLTNLERKLLCLLETSPNSTQMYFSMFV